MGTPDISGSCGVCSATNYTVLHVRLTDVSLSENDSVSGY